MKTVEITGFQGANAKMPFAERGERKPRASVPSYDPIIATEGEDGRTVYDPGRGFRDIFSQNHNTFASASGNAHPWYNNYVTQKDLNLLFYLASIGNYLAKYGLIFPRSQELSDKHGGYPWGAVVNGADGNRYISTKANNTDTVVAGSKSWIPLQDQWWFNSSNHNDNLVGQTKSSPLYKVMLEHPQIGTTYTFFRKEVQYDPDNQSLTRVAGIPLIVYRLHSVKESSGSQKTYTWVQAYKYWIRAYPNSESYTRYNNEQEPPQGWGTNPVSVDDDGKYYVDIYSDIATETRLKGKDGETYARVYQNSSTSGKIAGVMDAIGVAGSTYNGRAGMFTIDWGTNGNNNPFNTVDTGTYVQQYTAGNLELAIDIGMYGYGGFGQIPVVPEYDETEETIKVDGSLSVDQADANPNQNEYATYNNLRSGRNVLSANITFGYHDATNSNVLVAEQSPIFPNSVMWTTDCLTHAGEYLEASGSSTPLTHAEAEPTCPIAFPFSASESHHRLSSGPFFIRRSLSIDLYYNWGTNPFYEVKIANVGRQSWYEYTSGKIQRSSGMYSWWVYNVETIKDMLNGPNMQSPLEGYITTAWPAPETAPFLASNIGSGSGQSQGYYTIKMTSENVGLPRQYAATSSTELGGVKFDPIHGTYLKERMLIGLSSFPYEHEPNILTSESFRLPKPDVW